MTFAFIVTYLNKERPVIGLYHDAHSLPGQITSTDVRRAERAAGDTIYSPTAQVWLTYCHVERR